MEKSFDYIIQSSYPNYGAAGSIPDKFNPKITMLSIISMCVKTTKAEKFLTIVTILTKFYLKLNFFS